MGWKDLLQKENESVVFPWTGGRSVRTASRSWVLDGDLPREHGWYKFNTNPRRCTLGEPVEPTQEILAQRVIGYLVGDRIVPDEIRPDDPERIISFSEQVCLLDPGLDRFSRVTAGRVFDDGPLIFVQQEMPLGPEEDVLNAFLNKEKSLSKVKGVHPALDIAFKLETWNRDEAAKRRALLAKQRQEAEEKRQKEARRKQLAEKLGTGQGRRRMAKVDFTEAATAALAVGGAEYLDHRPSTTRGEFIVTYRIIGRRFQCICDETLHIINSGVCLRGNDKLFTLESLPPVIVDADRQRVLHVFMHAGDDTPGDRDDDDRWETDEWND